MVERVQRVGRSCLEDSPVSLGPDYPPDHSKSISFNVSYSEKMARAGHAGPIHIRKRHHHRPRPLRQAAAGPPGSRRHPLLRRRYMDPQHPDRRPRRLRDLRGRRGLGGVPGVGVLPSGEPRGGGGRMRGVRDAWGEFFRLPAELKRSYANAPTTYEGYGSRLGTEVGAELDWGDYFFLNLLPESAKDYAKWPTEPPNCREITEEYGREVVKLCGALLRLLSISLGLGADFLERSFGGAEEVGAACLRVSYYPKCPQPELTLGLSAHSDPGGLTVLSADDRVLGLQVRKAGRWITVRPLPGALIVNVGDQIQVITNGIYKSVEHRVVVNAVAERLSIAVFYNPRNDLLIGPAPELLTPEQPPLYRPMTYGEYRMFIRKNGPKGKVQVESLKTV
uniref:Fe2OG dioxygenase domain-containing protein n=1 Tax=Ananas comosus var. bracteatus TaxID=296719 RepID=A0A6V7NU19_ANACO|nr:unnamed protein product [Ananas comosus var. bracteatus]